MQLENLKREILSRWGSIKKFFGLPLLLVIAIAGLLIGVTTFQGYCDRQTNEKADAVIETHDRRAEASTRDFERQLELFNGFNEKAVIIVNALEVMTKNLAALAENDRRQDRELINLSEEYKNARFPKNNPTVSNQKNNDLERVRRSRPIEQRENDLLANDKRLYPD